LTTTLVVDASVALKWVLPEDDSDLADHVLDWKGSLHAPAFVFMEMANALCYQMRSGKLSAAAAAGCMADLRQAPLVIWDGEEPLASALELAQILDHPVYDCAYLALALHLDGAYVTADQRFWRKAQRPELQGRVLSLAEL
jgi:predicted nucleic acid-binding protein